MEVAPLETTSAETIEALELFQAALRMKSQYDRAIVSFCYLF